MYPETRGRRLRRTEGLRRMMRETTLSADDFIYPLFVIHGVGVRREIAAMPGNYQLSVDMLGPEIAEIAELRIPAVILFGLPERKDPTGSEGYARGGVVQQAIREIKRLAPELVIITDVCLCEYTDHGHCGVVDAEGHVLNDPTVELLQKMALSHACAGADIVAPSDMMDGRVGAIRTALDDEGFTDVVIMSYAVKYASGFYGPFREAADSAPQFGDRRGYQMDPPNLREAIREAEMDLAEGADIIMVKPALAYLDVVSAVASAFSVPIAAYNVSGEFSMVKAAAERGWIDERRVALEVLTAIKRAGADMILTYHAKDAVRWLSEI
ncbi:MAG: porphobilinogen synthase [Armatimonadetes bacterium]|nr:porphobilinogen synthase [Armatimonadota bacterium]